MEAAYTEIKFLLLSFEATDLPNLWDEVVSVQFSLDYVDLRGSQADYEWLSIKLRDSEVDVKNKLQSFLPPAGKANHETLYVIYYSGHACFKNGQGLVFRSHAWEGNLWDQVTKKLWCEAGPDQERRVIPREIERELEKYEASAGIRWSSIIPVIMAAQCDTLVMLDCFNDKFIPASQNSASIMQDQQYAYKSEFRKYLIGACEGYPLSWAFEEGFKSVGSSMSVSALVREISDSVYGPARLKYPPAFHLALAKNSLGEITIPRIESDYDHPWDSTDTSDESSPEKEE